MSKLSKSKKPPLYADRFTERQFAPYVKAIGQLVLAWNSLQEALSFTYQLLLVGAINDSDHNHMSQVRSSWYSIRSDRNQRGLLKAVVQTATEWQKRTYPKLRDDMEWLLKEVNSLEDARNNAAHSPLMLISRKKSLLAAALAHALEQDRVTPESAMGNPRALALAKKDLLTEFEWCRDSALTYRDFVIHINRALWTAGYTWPSRPKLPNRGQKKGRRDRRRLPPATQRAPPHPTSQP